MDPVVVIGVVILLRGSASRALLARPTTTRGQASLETSALLLRVGDPSVADVMRVLECRFISRASATHFPCSAGSRD